MKRAITLGVLILIVAVYGCPNQNQVTLPPPGSTASVRLYTVTFDNPPLHGLLVFAPPFTSGSTPAIVMPQNATSKMNGPGDVLIDHSGDVVVLNDGSNVTPFVTVYSQPVSASSSPFAQFNTGTTTQDNVYGGAIDAAGTLWLSNRNTVTPNIKISTVTPPFTNSSTLTTVLTPTNGIHDPAQIAFDNNGHMAVAEQVASDVVIYATPVTSASMPTAKIALTSFGQGVAFDSAGRLFATSAYNTIEVFTPPFSNGQSPSFTISGLADTDFITFDSSGNLWAPECHTPGSVLEFLPPFSSGSTPSLTITSTEDCLWAIAFGP